MQITSLTTGPLSAFEIAPSAVEPMLRVLRLANTAFDSLFYDVNVVFTELLGHGLIVVAEPGSIAAQKLPDVAKAFSTLDLSALSNPEGVILIIDAGRPPHVTPCEDFTTFVGQINGDRQDVKTISVTGVGSSALGSVAFAWNISTALDEPVAAIVPGYGVADVVHQALGGWFGFGMHSWWIKEAAQNILAQTMPGVAKMGRGLLRTVPGHKQAPTGAPLFRRGSGSSDVLHAILTETSGITRLFGHSKGALVIGNALLGLAKEKAEKLQIVTFGCPISEDSPAKYLQFLGLLDGLGQMNSWGNKPDAVILTHHSTNTRIPFSMPVSVLSRF